MSWRDVRSELPPKDPESDYGVGTFDSIRVLAANGRSVYVAYLQTWYPEDGDIPFPARWKLDGCDGHNLDGVTHWQPLPAMPLPPES